MCVLALTKMLDEHNQYVQMYEIIIKRMSILLIIIVDSAENKGCLNFQNHECFPIDSSN